MLLTLMGNNWMFQTERSGWWRMWLMEQTKKHIEAKNNPAKKPTEEPTTPVPPKLVKQPKRKLPAREKVIKRPAPEAEVRRFPVSRPISTVPSVYEQIGQMEFTTFSTTVLQHYSREQNYNVVDIGEERRKRRKKQDEEVLLLLAA